MGRRSRLGLVADPADARDRAIVIDAVNRLNMAFDHFDVDAMVEVFTEDCVLHHPHGVVTGHAQLRSFYDAYRPLTVGVRRHNANHVVDANSDGTLTVTSQAMLIRVAPPDHARPIGQPDIDARDDGLPAIFSHALTVDTFRQDPGHGWRIARRVVEDTTANGALAPGAMSSVDGEVSS